MPSLTSYTEVFSRYLVGIIKGDLGGLHCSSVVVDDNSHLFDDRFIRATLPLTVVLVIALSWKLPRFLYTITDLILTFFVPRITCWPPFRSLWLPILLSLFLRSLLPVLRRPLLILPPPLLRLFRPLCSIFLLFGLCLHLPQPL